MSEYTPKTSPERIQILDDNARKFILSSIDHKFLETHDTSSFIMTTDWLSTDEDSETKLAHKAYTDGEVKILRIAKHTKGGKRTSRKEVLTAAQYVEQLSNSILRLQKTRHEFNYDQDGVTYDVKLDEFMDSGLVMIEVDAPTDAQRELFQPDNFPVSLHEVTGDLDYYGYRVSGVL